MEILPRNSDLFIFNIVIGCVMNMALDLRYYDIFNYDVIGSEKITSI